MPVLNGANMSSRHIGGTTYNFSATRIDELGATEWTLVGIVADVSGSVAPFRGAIEACIKEVVCSCRHSPRADNMMLRMVHFDDAVQEIHGFRPLTQCHVGDYTGSVKTGGTTALFDAAHNVVESIRMYGQDLVEQDFEANAILFVITDGGDNASSLGADDVRRALADTITSEALDSMVSILVGVNVNNQNLSKYLNSFKDKAGFTAYIELADAHEATLAKLANFVSKSIRTQSQSLNTGAAPASLSLQI